MPTFTVEEGVNKAIAKYKGVEIVAEPRRHDVFYDKVLLSFSLNGSGYRNSLLIEKGYSSEEFVEQAESMLKWAQGIINENT